MTTRAVSVIQKELTVRIKPLVFLAFVALMVAYVLYSGIGSNPLVRAESIAPDFTLKSLDGREVSLSDFRGSVVFLNFWRTDCVPCAAEMPEMEAVQRIFKGRKFQMMPVSLDFDTEDVARFYEKHNLTMPAYLDPGQNVSSRFNVVATPETFLIDSEGKVAHYYVGERRWASPKMLAQLEKMIPSN
jgi:peroxiredoxin